jgi:glutaryl-CoA dehydrogenase
MPTQHEHTGDFYGITALLSAEDQALLQRVRSFMEEKVAPIITEHWARAEFPFEVIPDYAALGIAGGAYSGHGCAGRSMLLDGMVMLELARIDCSIATFHAVHSGLALAAGDAALRKDRRLWTHRAGRRLGRCPRPRDERAPRWRRLDPQWQ